MLFEQRFWEPVARGEVTLTFRRWKRRQAVAGRRHRTPAGSIEIDAVDLVTPADITEADARAAGYPSVDALVRDLRGTADLDLYRIRFHAVAGVDQRTALAESGALGPDDLVELDGRLARLDRASRHGAWTLATLRLIARRPATRAGDLAEAVGRERAPFKTDVRKLKALGLTESLEVGYRLTPRGETYLRARS